MVITLAELLYGIELSRSKTINRELVDEFTSRLSIVPWSVGAAEHYGQLCALLKRQGRPIGVMDLQIAAHQEAGPVSSSQIMAGRRRGRCQFLKASIIRPHAPRSDLTLAISL